MRKLAYSFAVIVSCTILFAACGYKPQDSYIGMNGESFIALNKNAVKFDNLSYIEVLNRGLGVMDSTATSLCMDNSIPIRVFGLDNPDNIKKVILGEEIGTLVK